MFYYDRFFKSIQQKGIFSAFHHSKSAEISVKEINQTLKDADYYVLL